MMGAFWENQAFWAPVVEVFKSQAFWALIGVLVGSGLTIYKDYILDRRNQSRLSAYAAIRIVCVLDIFIAECLNVALDAGEYQRSEQGYDLLEPTEKLPVLPEFASDIDWKSLEPNLVHKILSLPAQIESANRSIGFIFDVVAGPPDFDEYFDERRTRYCELGLAALALTKELRSRYKLAPKPIQNEDWDPEVRLPIVKAEIERKTEEAAARQRAMHLKLTSKERDS